MAMFKKILIGAVVGALVASAAMAIDPYTTRDVRDPVKLKARLDADFATVAAGVGVAAVTNVSAQTATVSGTVTPKTVAVTATGSVALVYQYITLTNVFNDVTNTFLACTNVPTATTTINVLNGAAVCTNVAVAVPGVTTNVAQQTN